MTAEIQEKIVGYLRGVRMVSVGNLASRIDMPISKLLPLLETLGQEKQLRFGGSGCQNACSSCAPSCDNTLKARKNEHTIVISMLMQRRDEE